MSGVDVAKQSRKGSGRAFQEQTSAKRIRQCRNSSSGAGNPQMDAEIFGQAPIALAFLEIARLFEICLKQLRFAPSGSFQRLPDRIPN